MAPKEHYCIFPVLLVENLEMDAQICLARYKHRRRVNQLQDKAKSSQTLTTNIINPSF